MLLEYRDARKLAEVLARKAAPNADSLFGFARKRAERALANGGEVEPLFCGSVYGTRDPCPSEWGAAAKALNIMHMAVNGVKPYAEGGGGGGGGRDAPCAQNHDCNNGSDYTAQVCAGQQRTYYLCDCNPNAGFDCAQSNDYNSYAQPCVSPDDNRCSDDFSCNQGEGLFKCGGNFSCTDFGGCRWSFEQTNYGCPKPAARYDCGTFQCSENDAGKDFECASSTLPPAFGCESKFSCHAGTGGGHTCSEVPGFSCLASNWFNCWDTFDCSPVLVVRCLIFNCDRSGYEQFKCGGLEGFSDEGCMGRVTCDWDEHNQFTCENYMP